MISCPSKCVICYTAVPVIVNIYDRDQEKVERESKTCSQNLLDDQLNVIFVLKHVFELTNSQLQVYLRNWGNPGKWLELCGRCKEDVCNVRKLFSKYNQIQRMFEKAKWEIQDKVRVQEEERNLAFVGKKKEEMGIEEVFYESRNAFMSQRVRDIAQNPFRDGDEITSVPIIKNEGGTHNYNSVEEQIDDIGSYSDAIGDDNVEDRRSSSPLEVATQVGAVSESKSIKLNKAKLSGISPLGASILKALPASFTTRARRLLILKKVDGYQKGNNYKSKSLHGDRSPVVVVAQQVSASKASVKENPGSPFKTASPNPVRRTNRHLLILKKAKDTASLKNDKKREKNDELKSSSDSVLTTRKRRAAKNTNLTFTPKKHPRLRGRHHCPICQAPFSIRSLARFSEHFLECLNSFTPPSEPMLVGKHSTVLKCSLCESWSCLIDNAKEFLEHIVRCRDQYDGKSIPWLHSVIKCNLCEGSKSCYLLYSEYIRHIYNHHQHKYGCTQCPYRAQTSPPVSGTHWKRCHKDLLETPKKERFSVAPEGTVLPLPHVPWWCPATDCLQELSDEDSRDLHLKTCQHFTVQSPERSFKCSFCDQCYFSDEELLMHRVIVHAFFKQANAPKCKQCNILFKTARQLLRHQRSVHGLNLFKCETCGAEFRSNDNMWSHVRLKHGNAEELRDYTCHVCQEAFGQKHRLRRHLMDTHCIFKCEDCQREFEDEEALVSHASTEHERTAPKSKVDKIRFASKVCRVESESNGEFCCTWESCGKKFKSRQSLYQHVTLSHKRASETVCSLCGRKLLTPAVLKKHMSLVHGGGKTQVVCDVCGKTLSSRISLHTHMKYAHVQEKDLPYRCDECGRGWRDKRYLATHNAKVHGVGFKCDVEGCLKVFAKKELLEDHKKYKHEGVEQPRPYFCQFCGKRFVEKTKMKIHEDSVHINKYSRPFKCPLPTCEKSFPTKKHVSYHMRYTHKIQKGQE